MRITRITTLVIETVETLVVWRAPTAGKADEPPGERFQPGAGGTDGPDGHAIDGEASERPGTPKGSGNGAGGLRTLESE